MKPERGRHKMTTPWGDGETMKTSQRAKSKVGIIYCANCGDEIAIGQVYQPKGKKKRVILCHFCAAKRRIW